MASQPDGSGVDGSMSQVKGVIASASAVNGDDADADVDTDAEDDDCVLISVLVELSRLLSRSISTAMACGSCVANACESSQLLVSLAALLNALSLASCAENKAPCLLLFVLLLLLLLSLSSLRWLRWWAGLRNGLRLLRRWC